MTWLTRTSALWLGLLTGCGGDGVAPADAAAPTAEAPPDVATVASTLVRLPNRPTHHEEQSVIAAIASLCAADCAPVLAAANDEALPDQHREALWWGIQRSSVLGGRAELRDEARRALDDPATPDGALRPAAQLVLTAPDGPAYLEDVLRSSHRIATRAAAGCALIESLPIDRWREHAADAATVHAMGLCATPWHYGQREGPPG